MMLRIGAFHNAECRFRVMKIAARFRSLQLYSDRPIFDAQRNLLKTVVVGALSVHGPHFCFFETPVGANCASVQLSGGP
jgi:hypothetical protein